MKDHPMNYPVLLDSEGSVAGQFGLAGVPASIYLKPGGEIGYFGFSLPHHLDQLIESIPGRK